MTRTNTTRSKVLGLLVVAILALAATVTPVGAASTTDLTVSITDDDNAVAPGETTTVEIAVANADGGVGAAELGVELSDPGVATVTDVSVLHDPGSTDNPVSAGSADVKYAFADSPDTGSVTVVEVTLQAAAEGSTDVDVVPNSRTGNLVVYDEGGAGYTLDDVGDATLTVETGDANAPPNADAGDDLTVTEGDTVSLDGSGSGDPDGSIASYAWTRTGSGPSVSLSDASAAQPTFTAPDVDSATTLTFELTVTDGDGADDSDTVDVTVQPVSTPPPDEDAATALNLSPSDELVGIDGTATFDVVAQDVDGGVGAYAMSISIGNASVANIDGITLEGVNEESLTDVRYGPGDASITMEAVVLDTGDEGALSLGTLSVNGVEEGTTDVSMSVDALGNEAGESYEVTGVTGASLEVSSLIVGDSAAPARDLNDDGAYEDVNGDGDLTVLDVQTLFDARDSDVVSANADRFDFNEDGEFTIVDIQALWDAIVSN
jgi:hypothetical protein